jgi:hypothetical protein
MSRFSFPPFQAFIPVPREMKEMWMAFGQTLNSLRAAFQNGIVLTENLSHFSYQGGVEHGVAITITHGLDRTPQHILLANGRVEFIRQLQVTSTNAVMQFRLFTATATSYGLRTLTDRLVCLDAAFFQEGDAVFVDGLPNTVTRVADTSIYLSNLVSATTQHTISLATERVKLLFL